MTVVIGSDHAIFIDGRLRFLDCVCNQIVFDNLWQLEPRGFLVAGCVCALGELGQIAGDECVLGIAAYLDITVLVAMTRVLAHA